MRYLCNTQKENIYSEGLDDSTSIKKRCILHLFFLSQIAIFFDPEIGILYNRQVDRIQKNNRFDNKRFL